MGRVAVIISVDIAVLPLEREVIVDLGLAGTLGGTGGALWFCCGWE